MEIETDTNDIKERLSIAYVTAVAGRAGCQLSKLDIDKQSIDVTVRPIRGKKVSVDLQLKSTSQDCVDDEKVTFSLPVKNYNDLRDTRSTALHFLVVLILESSELDWLVADEAALLIKRCAYWIDLRGYPPTSNETKINIAIPRNQLFDVAAIQRMMRAAYELLGTRPHE
ncbi:DUF4365 domain-containing protein [Agrobacterium sp. ICMP 6402]|uniref:DUF4365 domain-containing protein n=1 Tax=Agrobacterium sp. ICMP 6402 TaxID=2292443 RepID=UPI001294B43E|nr:DUF4365 domain-containing protein [Agrobacterium sp. ICMP 6402]MQB09386.1 DUF4365 domain-containing protein [Agrobacterium sp. ICMP 6402]